MIDKQIHANELKLRFLMTDSCNNNCRFCLNDFQSKPGITGAKFLDPLIAEKALMSYITFFREKYPLQVYFSGGEPTLHPNLLDVLDLTYIYGCRSILNTNGKFPMEMEPLIKKYTQEVHVGTYAISEMHARKVERIGGKIQCVHHPYVTDEFLEFYLNKGFQVKIFQNFFDDDKDKYLKFIEDITKKFPNKPLSFRHTGIQENRGPGCNGCKRKCITLKAAWVFPDGGTSPCPQLHGFPKVFPKTKAEWLMYFEDVDKFHTIVD